MVYDRRPLRVFPSKQLSQISPRKRVLHGTGVAMYIVGQERRLVDPPSQVVAGVRTVTTQNERARYTPTLPRLFAFLKVFPTFILFRHTIFRIVLQSALGLPVNLNI